MDAATYLMFHAFIADLKPFPVLLLLAVMFRFGWSLANDVRTHRRIGYRFSRIG